MDVSEVYYSARLDGQEILSPVQTQTDQSFQEERRQAEGRSMLQSGKTEQQSSVSVYKLVRVTPESATTPSSSGIPPISTSMKKIAEGTPEDMKTELENVESVYHTARMKREDSRHPEDPSTDAELRTKERKTSQFESKDSEDEDGSDEQQRRRTKKTEASAKVNKIQHSLRCSSGASKRTVDPADAKVGQTQHSPAKKSNSSSKNPRCKTSSSTSQSRSRSTRSSGSASRSISTEDTERDCRKNIRQKKKLVKKKDKVESSSSETSSSDDKDGIHDKPKHMLKPPRFDGKSSFETFMAQFSNCAQHNKWNRAEKLAYLRNSLDSEAANILWDYGKDVTDSLSGLTKILESRFGGRAVANKHQIELRNRRRRKDETLRSLHSDIWRLAVLAYPEVQLQMRDVITCDHFLDALGDPDTALKIRE